jgi:tetratricopeptide (TPR) repeat protein
MAPAREAAPRAEPTASPSEEARRLYHEAEKHASHPESSRYADALKRFLSFVEEHRRDFGRDVPEIAEGVDQTALAFYRLSQTGLALRAVDLGLALTPGSSTLLHHKAQVLLAANRNVDQAIPLLERALEANPHDKAIWATKGDALKLRGRRKEAVECYLAAQRLDATSTQYVDRALKLEPKNPVALRMKLQLSRTTGAEKPALAATEALLELQPKDPDLLLEKARLQSTQGDAATALETLREAVAERPGDPHVRFLRARLLFAAGRIEEGVQACRDLLQEKDLLDTVALGQLVDDIEHAGHAPDLLWDARRKLKELDPRNLGNLRALAKLAVVRDDREEAIDAFRSIVAVTPHELDAQRSLLDLLLEAGHGEEALEVGARLRADHPEAADDLRRLLPIARAARRPEVAREFAETILAAAPDDTEAQGALAWALAQLGAKEAALPILDALLSRHADDIRFLSEKRQLLIDLDRPNELPAVLDELFRLDPSRSEIALERGNLYLKRAFDRADGSAEREAAARASLVSYERAALDPTHRSAGLLGAARAARLLHDEARAIRAFREFLADPAHHDRADVYKELGHLLRESERPSEAVEAYGRAVQLGLEDADLLWALAESLAEAKQETKALEYVERLLKREPTNPKFLRGKGLFLVKSGHRTEGLAVLKAVVEARKNEPSAYFETADALRDHGAHADAIAYYGQGLRLEPKSLRGRLGLAETLVRTNRFEDALTQIDALLHEDPNHLDAWKVRAAAHRALGHDAEVLYSLKAILLLDPTNGPALVERYRLHLKAGEKAEAFECLSQLLIAPGAEAESPGAWLEHGDLAAELGRTEESNRSYDRALKLDPSRTVEIAARRARVTLRAGRPDLALEIVDSVPAAETAAARERTVPLLLLKAEILGALERPAEARPVYEELRKLDPRSLDAIRGVARSYLDEGKPSEAREFLRSAIPTIPPDADLFLLLGEAEAALGSLPNATEVLRKAVGTLPRSTDLWVRLGELSVRQESWESAAEAYGHAHALDGKNVDLLLRWASSTERAGRASEALALADQATALAPGSKQAWTGRGTALLALSRPDEARQSFERALALDSDFEPAKEGKRAALQRTRETTIDRYGREALLLEVKLQRAVTKNDLFVTLHVPFDLLDPVLQNLSRYPRIDLDRLSEAEMRELEAASCDLITHALEHRPPGIEDRGLSLADVAVLSPPSVSLTQIQRLFGYLIAVLDADLRPENLRLTPDVEELARKALAMPESQRTLFQLVRGLRVGVFKARLIKAVESAGRAVHAPLPSLDLGAFAPEFGAPDPASAHSVPAPVARSSAGPIASRLPVPAAAQEPGAGPGAKPAASSHAAPTGTPSTRCLGCGGIASVVHVCGASVCHHCIAQFPSCPKCGRKIASGELTPIRGAHPSAGGAPRGKRLGGFNPFRSLLGRSKAPSEEGEAEPPAGRAAQGTATSGRHGAPHSPSHPLPHGHPTTHPTPASKTPDHPPEHSASTGPAAVPPSGAKRSEGAGPPAAIRARTGEGDSAKARTESPKWVPRIPSAVRNSLRAPSTPVAAPAPTSAPAAEELPPRPLRHRERLEEEPRL